MPLSTSRRALGASIAAFAVFMVGAQAQTPLKPFKLGISAPVVTVLPVWLGDAGGFFEKNGLKVEVISMEGGTRGTQVLLSGEIQAMHVGLSPVVQANAAGADLRSVVSSSNKLPITIFTAKKYDPPLPRGAKFGISTFGSETDIAISILLPKLGMTRNDIEITQVGGTGQRYAALIAGRLEVAPLLEPAITQAKGRGFIPIFDLSESGDAWIFDSVVVSKAWLDANRDVMQRFVRGYMEGAWWGLNEEAKAKELIANAKAPGDLKAGAAKLGLEAKAEANYKLGTRFTFGLGALAQDSTSNVDSTIAVRLPTSFQKKSVFGSVAYRQSERASLAFELRQEESSTNLPEFNYSDTRASLTLDVSF